MYTHESSPDGAASKKIKDALRTKACQKTKPSQAKPNQTKRKQSQFAQAQMIFCEN